MAKKDFDIIAVGDCTLDVFLLVKSAKVICKNKKKQCLLCMDFGSKIPINHLEFSLGGNAANFIVGCNRLGHKTTVYTELGDGEVGEKVLKRFKKEKINLKYIRVNKGQITNYGVILKVKNDRTILSYKGDKKYKFPKLPKTKWMYLTSMTKGYEDIVKDIIEYCKKTGCHLCFGPGTYQLKNKNKELQLILKNTYVYISNKEEARILFTSRKKFNSSKELIRHLFDKIHKKGILYAAITDGKNGAYCSDGENVYYLKAIKIKPKDPTGAGDSFSAGFISALAHDYSIQEALRWGVINSYFVMQKIGAQNGLLYKKYILKYSEEFKNLKIKKI